MRILLLGRTGQVGSQLQQALQPLGEVVAPGRAQGFDFSEPKALADAVRALAPDVIVNAAAYTAVDRAESEPALARRINAEAPAALADAASALGAWLVHYSTDYVFDGGGSRPWREGDTPAPLGVYGRTKLEGEQAIQARHDRHLVFRTSWVHGPQGGNFVRTMLRLAAEREALSVVNDQIGAPTSAPLIAAVTARALGSLLQQPGASAPPSSARPAGDTAQEKPAGNDEAVRADRVLLPGVYHLAAAGETSWHGLACHALLVAREAGASLRSGPAQVHAIPSADYITPARRPLNSRLDTCKLQDALGLTLPPWQEGVRDTVLACLATPS